MQPVVKNIAGIQFPVADHAILMCGYLTGIGDGVTKLIPLQLDAEGKLMLSGGGGGGGGAVTVADGADVTIGALGDAAVAAGATGSVSAKLRLITTQLAAATPAGTNTIGYTRTAQYTGAPSSSSILTSDGTVFTLAAGEVGFIQNLDDAALAVKKGAGASTTSLHMLLKGGGAADDGTGGYVVIKDWVGAVSVAAMTGSPRFLAWKQAP